MEWTEGGVLERKALGVADLEVGEGVLASLPWPQALFHSS